MKYLKKVFSLLLALLMLITLCSCSEEQVVFVYEVSLRPQNIDPLLASNDSELTIVRNTFEGLTRYNADGELELGCAKEYSVSDDKLTYTFILHDNLVWSDGTKLTANDFEFAVQRAANPQTKTVAGEAIKIIAGAESALLGKTSYKNVSFKAINKTTLVVKLKNACDTFLESLSQPVFMPCNREFFNSCKGKYGLTQQHILSNGCYQLTRWQDNASIRLTKSNTYKGNVLTKISLAFITFKSDEPKKNNSISKTSDSDTDLTKIDYTQIEQAKEEGLKILTYYNKTYALVFNKNDYIATSPDLLSAFTSSLDRGVLNDKPDYLITADNILPPDSLVGSKTVGNISERPTYKYAYSKENSRAAFLRGVKKLSKQTLPKTVVLCPDNSDLHKILTNIISCWQNNLGAYLNIEKLSEEDLLQKVNSGDFTIALVPLAADDSTVTSFLSQFTSNSSQNCIGLKNSAYDKFVDDSMNVKNSSAVSNIIEAEKILINTKNVIPVVFYPTIYAISPDLKKVSVSPFDSSIDFSLIDK
ncbi:MAG: peptide ABC transporter substrate-binding protein [bacterium]|nr:peptide ABC transporter substrate-binding protein [bacterium]